MLSQKQSTFVSQAPKVKAQSVIPIRRGDLIVPLLVFSSAEDATGVATPYARTAQRSFAGELRGLRRRSSGPAVMTPSVSYTHLTLPTIYSV